DCRVPVYIFPVNSHPLCKLIFKFHIFRNPIRADASMSPKRIHERLIGEEISLSNVLVLVSQGVMTGLIEVEVNHIAIPTNPVPSMREDISLPNQNARKKKKGNNIPKIITGPFM
ncbi:hypothetical protein AKJ64_01845, partial [candidate division MSBL1 archaeon SCGC-AAA259E17]